MSPLLSSLTNRSRLEVLPRYRRCWENRVVEASRYCQTSLLGNGHRLAARRSAPGMVAGATFAGAGASTGGKASAEKKSTRQVTHIMLLLKPASVVDGVLALIGRHIACLEAQREQHFIASEIWSRFQPSGTDTTHLLRVTTLRRVQSPSTIGSRLRRKRTAIRNE